MDLLKEMPRPLLLAFRSQGLIRNNAVALGVDDSRRVALQVKFTCLNCLFYLFMSAAGVGRLPGDVRARKHNFQHKACGIERETLDCFV